MSQLLRSFLSSPSVFLAKSFIATLNPVCVCFHQQRPIDEACKHGHSKVVLKLLNKEAEVGPDTLKEAIDSGNEYV